MACFNLDGKLAYTYRDPSGIPLETLFHGRSEFGGRLAKLYYSTKETLVGRTPDNTLDIIEDTFIKRGRHLGRDYQINPKKTYGVVIARIPDTGELKQIREEIAGKLNLSVAMHTEESYLDAPSRFTFGENYVRARVPISNENIRKIERFAREHTNLPTLELWKYPLKG